MRWILILLAGACGLQAQERLDDARVSISYRELRTLIEASQKAPPPPPEVVVPAAVLSANYDLMAVDRTVEGTATFVVQTFTDGPHVITLIGEQARITSVEPADSLLILKDKAYAIALNGKVQAKVVLRLSAPLRETDGGLNLNLVPCPLSSLRLKNVQANETAAIEGGVLTSKDRDDLLWELGAMPSLNLTVQRRVDKPKPTAPVVLTGDRVQMPAVVRNASSEMRVVRDGSYMNETKWLVRHDGALNWTLAMPEGCELLQCKVGDQPAAPVLQDARTWVIQLPAPKAGEESRVALSYTGKQAEFQPVRGEFSGTLPGTSLLVEKLEWRLQLPPPYETVAIQGNVDFIPGAANGELHLTRELGRGDAANVHVFYQKPENPSKQ